MIKRRTKRQQQKGRKEPKAKRKLSKRMLKKKTTLKMEIPKLMRYFSCTKAGNRARCAGSAAAGALLGSRGWGGCCHTVRTEQLWYLPRRACRNGLPLPAPSCSAGALPQVLPAGPGPSWGCLTAMPRFEQQWSPRTSPPSSPELALHSPSGLLGSSAAHHGLVLSQKSGFKFYTIL